MQSFWHKHGNEEQRLDMYHSVQARGARGFNLAVLFNEVDDPREYLQAVIDAQEGEFVYTIHYP